MCLGLFGTFAKKVNEGFWRCNSSKSVCFLRSIVTLCFKELGLRNLTTKISSLSLIVLSHCSDKIFAHHSISASKFCKDLQKFACFMVFGSKWACLIKETLKNLKFYTYWLTLVYTVQTVEAQWALASFSNRQLIRTKKQCSVVSCRSDIQLHIWIVYMFMESRIKSDPQHC